MFTRVQTFFVSSRRYLATDHGHVYSVYRNHFSMPHTNMLLFIIFNHIRKLNVIGCVAASHLVCCLAVNILALLLAAPCVALSLDQPLAISVHTALRYISINCQHLDGTLYVGRGTYLESFSTGTVVENLATENTT